MGAASVRSPCLHKLDRGLQRAIEDGSNKGSGRRRVIIRTRAGVNLRGREAFDKLAEKTKDGGGFALSLVGGVLAEVKDKDLEQLAAMPDVDGISVDAPVQAHQSATDPCSTVGDRLRHRLRRRRLAALRSCAARWATAAPTGTPGTSASRSSTPAWRRATTSGITASYDFRTGIAPAGATRPTATATARTSPG